jgi:hypothetical protein
MNTTRKAYTTMIVASGLAIGIPASSAELDAPLAACLATKTAIGDVGSCGKIWRLKSGSAQLKADGSLEVDAKGLVLNDPTTAAYNGTPDGVDAVAVAVICTGPGGASVVAQTDPVALSKAGDVHIRAKVNLPSNCIAPVIALRERYEGKIGGWLAATGF